MCVTVGGRKTASTEVQLLKACSPMDTRLEENRMNLREAQQKKANPSISVTVSGIVIRTRD